MSREFINYIVQYGYLSVFLLVFLQEIGLPSFPNELALIYFGYLAYQSVLKLFLVLILAISADVSGTILLYVSFYFFSAVIIKHKPKWIHIPHKTIQSIKIKMKENGGAKIFTGRLIPYIRGYTSVVAGFLRINALQYSIMVLLSAMLWSGGFVMIGWMIAPYWENISSKFSIVRNVMLAVPAALIIFFCGKFFSKKRC